MPRVGKIWTGSLLHDAEGDSVGVDHDLWYPTLTLTPGSRDIWRVDIFTQTKICHVYIDQNIPCLHRPKYAICRVPNY